MARIEWQARFELGVAQVDREHRGLVDAMNRIHELSEEKAGKAAIDAAIQKLAELTTQHFRDEELYMEKIGYADRERHGLIHEDMLRKVTEHHEEFRSGDGTLSDRFLQFLVNWLSAHICHIDRKYVDANKPAGV
ncbi:MAG: bacteriohemerythrin [Planctomycetota bacterium]